jgi:predicted acetyltransferase
MIHIDFTNFPFKTNLPISVPNYIKYGYKQKHYYHKCTQDLINAQWVYRVTIHPYSYNFYATTIRSEYYLT